MTAYYPSISPADFEKAVARACLRAAGRWTREEPYRGGDQTAVRYGPLIGEIADEADLSIPQTRRRLQALQRDGRMLRDDRRGGSTAWWLVGLAAEQRATPPAPVAAAAPARQTVKHVAIPARQHWSDVLGVPRDASTSEVRAAWLAALAAVNDSDLDADLQRKRIHEARSERAREDNLSEYE